MSDHTMDVVGVNIAMATALKEMLDLGPGHHLVSAEFKVKANAFPIVRLELEFMDSSKIEKFTAFLKQYALVERTEDGEPFEERQGLDRRRG